MPDKVIRQRCYVCKAWNDKEQKWIYHLAQLTSWRPQAGIEPRLREFHCSFCEGTFYQVLTPEKLYQSGAKEYA